MITIAHPRLGRRKEYPVVVSLLRHADHRVVPWANGGGTAREIAVANTTGRGVDHPAWRLSLATIDRSGAFSVLPGVDRALLCLGPEPIRLRINAHDRRVPVHGTTRFAGDAEVHCEVERPTRALNAMVGSDRAPADLEIVTVSTSTADAQARMDGNDGIRFVVVLDGQVVLQSARDADTLGPLDAAHVEAEEVELQGDAMLAMVRFP